MPEIRFAQAAGSTIAYEVFGEGPVTICVAPPLAQNVELVWESPLVRRMFERYASFSRQVIYDKRGTGLSDRTLDVPGLDERVDELRAVMDDAGVSSAYIHGVSEGGPMAIMFAATYPDRVDGLILEGTAASLLSDQARAERSTPEGLAAARERWSAYVSAWGTSQSRSIALFAPSLLADEEFVRWWSHYERHAISRDSLLALFQSNGDTDARGVLDRVECPVLIVHRTGDPVVSIERARETLRLFEAAGAEVRMEEVPGGDHYAFAGDVDAICDAVERFTTGTVRSRPTASRRTVRVTTMGRFAVVVDGVPVPVAEWGSRRARTLLKRLVVARGWPVPREELIEVLWPGECSNRLNARLSVQLSALRRVLGGGVVADRSTVRLDLSQVSVDLEAWFRLTADQAVVDGYADLLPEDRYEDWSGSLRDEMRDRVAAAARRLGEDADPAVAVAALRNVVEIDPYDEGAHRLLVRRLHGSGRLGEAAEAQRRLDEVLAELGL
ncbi:MAG: alpha/beta fold hydrolase [Dermatophilaceae bacterium]|nr:alpha/beta fold hydrolase [Intrasporangiaceae bacterium]